MILSTWAEGCFCLGMVDHSLKTGLNVKMKVFLPQMPQGVFLQTIMLVTSQFFFKEYWLQNYAFDVMCLPLFLMDMLFQCTLLLQLLTIQFKRSRASSSELETYDAETTPQKCHFSIA